MPDAIEEIGSRSSNAMAAWAQLIANREARPATANNASSNLADAVVLTVDAKSLRKASTELKSKGESAKTDTAEMAQKARDKELEAARLDNEAKTKKFEAAEAEREAAKADSEAKEAADEQAWAEQKAQALRVASEAKQNEAYRAQQEAEFQKCQGETLLANGDCADKLNQGIALLTMADSSLQNANSLRDQAVTLSGSIQFSIDQANSSRQEAASKLQHKGEFETSSVRLKGESREDSGLSERAREAAQALKQGSAGRREVADRLLAEADASSELADLGDKIQDGFLLVC